MKAQNSEAEFQKWEANLPEVAFAVQLTHCARCQRPMIGPNADPDGLCGECGKDAIQNVADAVLAYRPKSKRPKPRKKKKSKRNVR